MSLAGVKSCEAFFYCQGSATSTFLTRNLARFQTNSINKRPYAGSTPAAGSTQPRRTLYLAFCGAFLFGMRKLLERILKRGNGVNVGRRDLISKGVTVDILERGSVRPAATFLDVGPQLVPAHPQFSPYRENKRNFGIGIQAPHIILQTTILTCRQNFLERFFLTNLFEQRIGQILGRSIQKSPVLRKRHQEFI